MLKALKMTLRRWFRSRWLEKAIKARGGREQRDLERKARMKAIRDQKEAIARGLMLSWNLKEIKPPRTEELYRDIRFFHHHFTLKQLEEIEKWHWS